jgi:hypothetical protein
MFHRRAEAGGRLRVVLRRRFSFSLSDTHTDALSPPLSLQATATATAQALSATHVTQLRELLHARAAMSAALEQELDVLVAQA